MYVYAALEIHCLSYADLGRWHPVNVYVNFKLQLSLLLLKASMHLQVRYNLLWTLV